MERNRELMMVPGSSSLVRERALTTGPSAERWYCEHSGVRRRADLAGSGLRHRHICKCQITVANMVF